LVLVQDDIDKAILTELGQFPRAEVYFFSISVTLRVTKPAHHRESPGEAGGPVLKDSLNA